MRQGCNNIVVYPWFCYSPLVENMNVDGRQQFIDKKLSTEKNFFALKCFTVRCFFTVDERMRDFNGARLLSSSPSIFNNVIIMSNINADNIQFN